MKKIIYILSIMAFFVSCKSIDKMVEQGKYDEAILYAAAKLQGEKNKKTKYVKGLEEAFAKITTKDLDHIKYLLALNNDQYWDRIYDSYSNIKNRQDRISPFLPLISEDGYQAKFKFIELNNLMAEAANKSSEYHYQYAKRLISESRDSKASARSAYRELETIERYFYDYKDKRSLMDTARFMGTTRINIDIYNDSWGNLSKSIEEDLWNSNISGLQDFWTTYYLGNSEELPIDYEVTIELKQLNIDPGFERINTFEQKAEIRDGNKPKKVNGEVVKDSLGQIVMVPKYINVNASVTELWREKIAELSATIKIFDNKRQRPIESIPISIAEHFKDSAVTFTGDKRALSAEVKTRLDDYCAYFPSDYQMVNTLSNVFKDLAFGKIKKCEWA